MKREWLINYRKSKGLLQQDVAKICDITQQAYAAYEIGTKRPSPETAQKIAKVLNFKWTKFYEN